MIAIFMATSARSSNRPPRLRVAVLAYPGCSAWVATGIRESFTLASLLQQPGTAGQTRIDACWISPVAGPVTASAGVVIQANGRGVGTPDIVVVPPVWHTSAADFEEQLALRGEEVALLRSLARQGVSIASVCSGVALLARAGLLDDRAATGCWWLEQPLRLLYPNVRWQFDDTLVRDGSIVTAGSGAAFAGLVFELLEHAAGRDLAVRTAGLLGIEPNRHRQSSFAQLIPLSPSSDPLVARFERHVLQHLAKHDLDIARMAAALHVSARTLHRRMQAARGETPLRFIQRARLEHAKSLLAGTSLPVEDVCARCGWSDVSSFRKLFAREVGMTAAAWRKGFGSSPWQR